MSDQPLLTVKAETRAQNLIRFASELNGYGDFAEQKTDAKWNRLIKPIPKENIYANKSYHLYQFLQTAMQTQRSARLK